MQQRYNYIPIDFIKCKVIGLDVDHFKQNMDLTEYESKKENKSKYLFYKKDNIIIKYYVDSGLILLSGSIHKYFNKGFHNHNQFTHQNYLDALKRLKNEFAVNPENLYIQTLEYGFNIQPPIKIKSILDNLLMHRQTEIETIVNKNRGYYKQLKHDKYIFKIYDKSKQYKLNDNLLRLEIKQTNWSENRLKHGLTTLADFNKIDKSMFFNNLLKKWNELIFYDPTMIGMSKWNKYSNINFWRNVGKQKSKHLKRLRELNKTKSEDVQRQITDLIKKTYKGVQNSNLSKKRTCKLTGIDISNQQKNSFLLSHNGLKKLEKEDLQRFNHIKKIFLSDKWQTSSDQKQIKEIAHNIRAKYNYQQHHKPPNQLQLF